MKIRLLGLLLVAFAVNFYSSFSFSQNLNDINIKGRYLVIDDINKFFVENEGNMIAENFQLHNIYESESSKPIHVGVIEIPNVIKFSIESSSSIYENQRRCKIVVKKDNYMSTFRKIVSIMDVQYIVSNGEIKKVDDFFNLQY